MRAVQYLALASALAFASPASAINFDATIVQLGGEPFVGVDGKASETTIATICENALLTVFADEQNLAGEEKVKRFLLAQRIHKREVDSISVDDIHLIKKLVGKAYGALVVGQVWKELDPASSK